MKKKTHKATAKRFKVTKNGKVKHFHQGDNAHLKVNKSSKQKARQNGTSILSNKKEARKIASLVN